MLCRPLADPHWQVRQPFKNLSLEEPQVPSNLPAREGWHTAPAESSFFVNARLWYLQQFGHLLHGHDSRRLSHDWFRCWLIIAFHRFSPFGVVAHTATILWTFDAVMWYIPFVCDK